MTTIKSKTVTVNSSGEEIKNFFSDLNKLEKLMPQDRIENWESTEETCSFSIKGLATIGMKREDADASKVKLVSHGKNPFPFTLSIIMSDNGEGTSDCYVEFEGKMNAMLSMMAKQPLTNFFNMLVDELKAINE